MGLSEPKLYTKKPVDVEAMYYDPMIGFDSARAICKWMFDNEGSSYIDAEHKIVIMTLEGPITASLGDYIIRGVEGEFYPCRESIFKATYLPAVPDGN